MARLTRWPEEGECEIDEDRGIDTVDHRSAHLDRQRHPGIGSVPNRRVHAHEWPLRGMGRWDSRGMGRSTRREEREWRDESTRAPRVRRDRARGRRRHGSMQHRLSIVPRQREIVLPTRARGACVESAPRGESVRQLLGVSPIPRHRRGIVGRAFRVIDRKLAIDISSDGGQRWSSLESNDSPRVDCARGRSRTEPNGAPERTKKNGTTSRPPRESRNPRTEPRQIRRHNPRRFHFWTRDFTIDRSTTGVGAALLQRIRGRVGTAVIRTGSRRRGPTTEERR